MLLNGSTARLVRFGVFELDLKTAELRKRGLRVRLQEQPFRVLVTLVEQAGELVSRDELRARLWHGAVFVDFDHGLNKAVAKIRSALGDLADSPAYIETLERRGYRFLAPVEAVADRSARPDGGAPTEHRVRLVWDDRTIVLTSGPNLIGRVAGACVVIDSPEVSRRHAQITLEHEHAELEDLGSKNGTFLNGSRVDIPASLDDGDAIRIGHARFLFRSTPASGATRTAANLAQGLAESPAEG
jgi:DNA-binding winged helix-turn-helix (wHTH) protein